MVVEFQKQQGGAETLLSPDSSTSKIKVSLGSYNRGTQRAIKSPTIRDLEWAAGFLEGEGCFAAYRASRGERVSCDQNEFGYDNLQRLQELFGGSILDNSRAERKYEIYKWVVYGYRARGVMITLYSLLSNNRKQQIDKALKWKLL